MDSKVVLSFLVIILTLLTDNNKLGNCSGSTPIAEDAVVVCCNLLGDLSTPDVTNMVGHSDILPIEGVLYGVFCTLYLPGVSCYGQLARCESFEESEGLGINCEQISNDQNT